MSSSPTPFSVDVPERLLVDLRERLGRVRYPKATPAPDWIDGTDVDYLQDLLAYWRDTFDWRDHERRINQLPQFIAEAAGRQLHFVHARSREPDATPLLLVHGWPGSFWEFHRILPMLLDPVAHGGDASDAFHVVIPSLPGYGWSSAPIGPGCDTEAIARAFAALMGQLGYDRYLAQGGDWGSRIVAQLGVTDSDHVMGVHLSFPGIIAPPPDHDGTGFDQDDLAALRAQRQFARDGAGYLQLQSTRPQTPAYALSDSPAGLAAWLVEKFHAWTDHTGDHEAAVSRDDLLTIITTYWVTNSIGPSMRLYREHDRQPWTQRVPVPAACAVFPAETSPPVRSWVESFLDVHHWSEMPRGGHFAALEQPALLAEDIRRFARSLSRLPGTGKTPTGSTHQLDNGTTDS